MAYKNVTIQVTMESFGIPDIPDLPIADIIKETLVDDIAEVLNLDEFQTDELAEYFTHRTITFELKEE